MQPSGDEAADRDAKHLQAKSLVDYIKSVIERGEGYDSPGDKAWGGIDAFSAQLNRNMLPNDPLRQEWATLQAEIATKRSQSALARDHIFREQIGALSYKAGELELIRSAISPYDRRFTPAQVERLKAELATSQRALGLLADFINSQQPRVEGAAGASAAP